MADTFYGIAVGAGLDPSAITVQASTTGAAIELRVLNGAGISKVALLNALETIENRIVENDAPA
jgi:hypothetical protein